MGEIIYAEGQFLEAFGALFDLVDQYPPDKRQVSGACGDWSAKDVLAHLAGWMVVAQNRYDDFNKGDTSNINYREKTDIINAESIAVRSHLNWKQVIAELRLAVFALSSRASSIPTDTTKADSRYEEWLVGLAKEASDHTAELKAFLEK